MEKNNQINNGVKYMLIASFTFALMGAFAKLASESMSSLEVVFFRNIAGVILVGYAVYKTPLKQVGGKPFLLFFHQFFLQKLHFQQLFHQIDRYFEEYSLSFFSRISYFFH